MSQVPLYRQGAVVAHAEVDESDLGPLSAFRWTLAADGYARRSLAYKRPDGRWFRGCVLMHRAVSGATGRMHTDHINGNKLDNRRANLRVCTASQNGMNRGAMRRNQLGLKGVTRDRSRWRACIRVKGVARHLGNFADPTSAYVAYCEAAIEMHGEFANTGSAP